MYFYSNPSGTRLVRLSTRSELFFEDTGDVLHHLRRDLRGFDDVVIGTEIERPLFLFIDHLVGEGDLFRFRRELLPPKRLEKHKAVPFRHDEIEQNGIGRYTFS